jgi:hypothetical protein
MPRTTDAPGEAGLHAALHRLAHSTYSSHWPRIEPDYAALKAALYELAAARPVVAAARALLEAHTPPGAHWLGGTPFGALQAALAARDGAEEGEGEGR